MSQPIAVLPRNQAARLQEKGLLIDVSRCIGCRACEDACKSWHELNEIPQSLANGAGEAVSFTSYETPVDLSPEKLLKIKFSEFRTPEGEMRWRFRWHACLHCDNAPCVQVCPTKALSFNQLGFVSVETEKCIGCGYCAIYCPFDVPRLHFDTLTGQGKAYKCNFCQDKVSNGLPTSCAAVCPTQAITFGNREELRDEAHCRLERMRQTDPRAALYGDEMPGYGSTHVLFLLPDGQEHYEGLPEKPAIAPQLRLWQQWIKRLGDWAIIGMLVACLTHFLVAIALMRNKSAAHFAPAPGEPTYVKRFSLADRILHWGVGIGTIGHIITGYPLFRQPTASLTGASEGTRLWHRVFAPMAIIPAVLYVLRYPLRALRTLGKLLFWKQRDFKWLVMGPRLYTTGNPRGVPEVGQYNAGQKILFLVVIGTWISFGISGVMLWFGRKKLSRPALRTATVTHSLSNALLVPWVILHLYLSIFHPISRHSLRGMLTGKLSRRYAEQEHGAWLREQEGRE